MKIVTQGLMPLLFSAALIALPLSAMAVDDIDIHDPPPGQQAPGQQVPSQQPPGTGQHQPGAALKTEVTVETLEKFAGAFSEILVIQETFTEKLESATSSEEAQALQQEAQNEMVQAVEDNGLSIAEYNQVVAMMEQDPRLRERIIQMAN